MAEQNWLEATPSKTSFVFGLILGIGAMSLIALVAVLAFLVKGDTLNLGNAAVGAIAAAPVVNPDSYAPDAPAGPVDIAITDKDHIRGNKDAKVTLVEFSDFQCPYCSRHEPTMTQALTEYKDKIRVIYKHFPLESIHPFARAAAEASECAAEQGKFWEYHDELFNNQDKFANDYFGEAAKQLGLDTNKFNACVTTNKGKAKVDADYQQGIQAGVQGTPQTFVNGVGLSGAIPYASLKTQIDAALAE